VDYAWQWKDDPTKIVPKLSYVKEFEPWGWIIGTGMYIEDVHAEIALVGRKLSAVSIGILLVVSLLTFSIIRQTILADRTRRRIWKERERLVETLGESERRLHTLMNNLPGMAYRCLNDENWTMEFISEGCFELTGYETSDLIGNRTLSYNDLIHPDDRGPVWDRVQEALAGKQSFKMVYRIGTAAEKEKWVWEQGVGVFSPEGDLLALEGFITDITNYMQAKEELRKHRDRLEELVQERTIDLIESEEKYRTLVENVPLVVYRMSPNGAILLVNQSVEDTFGYSPAEIFRNPELWIEKVYDEDRSRVEELREKSFWKGEEFIAEYRVRHKNGRIVYVMDHAIPFQEDDGRISSVDGIIMDVTGRVRLQEKLVRAEELKTISEVSARLAHEIRNPLMSAGGFARRLLSSMSPDDPNRAKVEIIVKEVGRLESILRAILSYIQPLELYMSPTDPNRLVEAALSAVDMEIKERDVRVDLRLAPGLPEISADRAQMERVVETLVKNALNQTREGATIRVSTFLENDVFKLVMRYTARHISSDDVEHFFYPFTTLRMVYDIADLPICKILVDKHGGVIDVALQESGELLIQISLPL
jgi:PAS domain S-box-containing protein